MSLERLVEEIRARGAAQVHSIEETAAIETAKITADRDQRVLTIQEESERAAAIEASRERAQRVAAAKLRSRQRLYEAREARMKSSLSATHQLLADYTTQPEYRKVLERMYRYAAETLGEDVRLKGRAEDAAALKRIAPGRVDPTP
ncbi:MAG: V-type ATP synthase subunit E family protein, partial [Thermoplasmata archaeon]